MNLPERASLYPTRTAKRTATTCIPVPADATAALLLLFRVALGPDRASQVVLGATVIFSVLKTFLQIPIPGASQEQGIDHRDHAALLGLTAVALKSNLGNQLPVCIHGQNNKTDTQHDFKNAFGFILHAQLLKGLQSPLAPGQLVCPATQLAMYHLQVLASIHMKLLYSRLAFSRLI